MKSIMKNAWRIARNAAAKFGGRAAEYIAEALRIAWAESRKAVRSIVDRIDELTAMGFKRWTKNGMDRMYVNASTLGLICTYRHTGSIQCAEFRGEQISNSQGYRLQGSKTYIDLKLRRIVSDSPMLAAAVADDLGIHHSYGETIIPIS